ncbi:MAG: hypothetical protein AB7I27_13545 [Bacteriovoracaceae bacterium]
MKVYISVLIIYLLTSNAWSAALGIEESWRRISDPLIMSSSFNRVFSSLPLKGEVIEKEKHWSSDYWARRLGGINYRWNSSNPRGFNLVSPTKKQALKMTQNELSSLSPAEKMDLLNGNYTYPIKNEIARYASPQRPYWEGICDGWAAAASNHYEPSPKTLINPDGIPIPFGSADIKGLLSWYYARKVSTAYSHMGLRCRGGNSEERCREDMNAGAFHIVLTNRLGVRGYSFIADIMNNAEVWNHITYSYATSILNDHLPPLSNSAPGTSKVVRVKTNVRFVDETKNYWDPVLGTSHQKYVSRNYHYYLDLDSHGNIIGGDWISSSRPDFLWLAKKTSSFRGDYSKLPLLLD